MDTKQIPNWPLVVVAIDFGTTYSGFAFSFHHEPDQFITATTGCSLPKDRVPTCVLLNSDKSFHSFGYEAQETFASLVEDSESLEWYYFEHFKMSLYSSEKLHRDIIIRDTTGKEMKALDVFSTVIKHLKDLALDTICQSKAGLRDISSDVKWVLTIPAIWTDAARQFMREAAAKAGIDENKLCLTLEPEAASLFSRRASRQSYSRATNSFEHFQPGHKYIMADLGGGTADICVHEVLESGKLRELYSACGGSFGGNNVDDKFLQFLIKLFGADILKEFKDTCMTCYMDIMKDFQRCKETFSGDKVVRLTTPTALVNLIHSHLHQTMEDVLNESDFRKQIQFKSKVNKLVFTHSLFATFFDDTVNEIVATITNLMKTTDAIDTVVLVGGFSESKYLRNVISSNIQDTTLILEQDSKLAVLKGAVLMGFEPYGVIERRARFTYGIKVWDEFDRLTHPDHLRIKSGGVFYCDMIFKKLIEKDTIMSFRQEVPVPNLITTLTTEEEKHANIEYSMYKSTENDPRYCDEPGCTELGKIVLSPPSNGWSDVDKFESFLIVGETEFQISVKSCTTDPDETAPAGAVSSGSSLFTDYLGRSLSWW